MSIGLRLDIEQPKHGWVAVHLRAAGISLDFIASYTPRDSISDLAQAAVGLAAGDSEQSVIWNTEPTEYEFRFAIAGSHTILEVRRFPDRRRQRQQILIVGGVDDGTVAMARSLWRTLRRLQGCVTEDEFALAWGHPFPTSPVHRLGERLKMQAALEG